MRKILRTLFTLSILFISFDCCASRPDLEELARREHIVNAEVSKPSKHATSLAYVEEELNRIGTEATIMEGITTLEDAMGNIPWVHGRALAKNAGLVDGHDANVTTVEGKLKLLRAILWRDVNPQIAVGVPEHQATLHKIAQAAVTI